MVNKLCGGNQTPSKFLHLLLSGKLCAAPARRWDRLQDKRHRKVRGHELQIG